MRATAERTRQPSTTADVRKLAELLAHGVVGTHHYVMLLGLQTYDVARLTERVRRGLPYSALERFQHNAPWSAEEILDWVQIPERTAARRKQGGQLTPEESDRLLRAARIFAKAIALFEGDVYGAAEWLSSPLHALGGAIPTDFAKTDIGAREVENVIERLEHGVYT